MKLSSFILFCLLVVFCLANAFYGSRGDRRLDEKITALDGELRDIDVEQIRSAGRWLDRGSEIMYRLEKLETRETNHAYHAELRGRLDALQGDVPRLWDEQRRLAGEFRYYTNQLFQTAAVTMSNVLTLVERLADMQGLTATNLLWQAQTNAAMQNDLLWLSGQVGTLAQTNAGFASNWTGQLRFNLAAYHAVRSLETNLTQVQSNLARRK